MHTQALLGLSLLLLSNAVIAHEYWLDPVDSSISRGSSAIIDVRNGENFTGSAFPYDNSKFQSISVSSKAGSEQYQGRLGDYPAIHSELDNNGLYSINVDTKPKHLSYKSWEQFQTFLQYHALDSIEDQHLQRNLPITDIKERYVRSAKTVLQVNNTGTLTIDDSANNDVETHPAFTASGAVFELQLLDNPYSNTDTVRVKLLFHNKPLSGRQVELFWKGSTLLRLTETTNEDGIARFKLLGSGDYLINSVHVTRPLNDDVHWLSHWASMTFER